MKSLFNPNCKNVVWPSIDSFDEGAYAVIPVHHDCFGGFLTDQISDALHRCIREFDDRFYVESFQGDRFSGVVDESNSYISVAIDEFEENNVLSSFSIFSLWGDSDDWALFAGDSAYALLACTKDFYSILEGIISPILMRDIFIEFAQENCQFLFEEDGFKRMLEETNNSNRNNR